MGKKLCKPNVKTEKRVPVVKCEDELLDAIEGGGKTVTHDNLTVHDSRYVVHITNVQDVYDTVAGTLIFVPEVEAEDLLADELENCYS